MPGVDRAQFVHAWKQRLVKDFHESLSAESLEKKNMEQLQAMASKKRRERLTSEEKAAQQTEQPSERTTEPPRKRTRTSLTAVQKKWILDEQLKLTGEPGKLAPHWWFPEYCRPKGIALGVLTAANTAEGIRTFARNAMRGESQTPEGSPHVC